MKPYKIGLVSICCVISQEAIIRHREYFPAGDTPEDEEVITNMVENYCNCYFTPWRRRHCSARGYFLDYVAQQHKEDDEESVATHCNLRSFFL